MTKAIPKGAADVVVWAEGASPYDLNEDGRRQNLAAKALSELAKDGHFDLVVGGGTRLRTPDPEMGEEEVEVFNSVYWFGPDGRLVGHYDKLVPLPFGEYLPFGWMFPEWLGDSLGIGSFRAGKVPVVFEGGNVKAATPICYEAVLPATCRLFADADLLITVTNDAWFGDTANPWQHEMMAATRATELGIPMYRSAYTGVSAAIEPHGVIHSETRPFQRTTRIVEVRVATFPTFYKRFGDWFVALCATALASALWMTRSR
jgi:apolipoprotein N-acyltransferase